MYTFFGYFMGSDPNVVPLSTSVKELAKLCNESNLEKTFHILNEDDRELSCILKSCLATPPAPATPSEAE